MATKKQKNIATGGMIPGQFRPEFENPRPGEIIINTDLMSKNMKSDIIYTSLIGTLESAQRAGLIITDWSVSRDVIEVKKDNPDGWKHYKQGPITNLTVEFTDPTKTKE